MSITSTTSEVSTAYTISPSDQTEIELKVQPDAKCWLHAQGDDDPNHRIMAFADGEGFVRFHVGTKEPSVAANVEPVTLVIDAEVGSTTRRHELALRAAVEPTHEFPPPPTPRAPANRAGAVEYPGLEEGKALQISAEEASVLGIPPRPDRRREPERFDEWLSSVTRPTVFVAPHLRDNPHLSHLRNTKKTLTKPNPEILPLELSEPVMAAPANSYNWCGYERLQGYEWGFKHGRVAPIWDSPFTSVHGRWTVPTVYPPPNPLNNSAYSSAWVGIDGDGLKDLVQAGTEHDSLALGFMHVTIYQAWTEFLPQQGTERVIANFAVAPGDDVRVTVDLQLADGTPSRQGNAAFIINNLTKNVWTVVNTPRGSTRVFGTEAVWITERPTVNKSLPDLANFGSVTMTEAIAGREDSSMWFVPYLGTKPATDNTINTMTSVAGDVLATVTALDNQSLRFDWQRSS
jgi:hypothetical protein